MANYTERWEATVNSTSAASEDINAKIFVKNGTKCTKGSHADGVSISKITSGRNYALHVAGDINVTGSGTVTAGDSVISDANGKAIKKIADEKIVNKTANQSKTSDTTLADDLHLKDIPVAAGLKYAFFMKLAVTNADASNARSIKYRVTVPTNATLNGSIEGAAAVAGAVNMTNENADITATLTHQISANESGFVKIEGILDLTTVTADGLIALQWAQSSSDTDAITLQKDSMIKIECLTKQKTLGTALTTATNSDVLIRLNL